jgi:hypothetical protein
MRPARGNLAFGLKLGYTTYTCELCFFVEGNEISRFLGSRSVELNVDFETRFRTAVQEIARLYFNVILTVIYNPN